MEPAKAEAGVVRLFASGRYLPYGFADLLRALVARWISMRWLVTHPHGALENISGVAKHARASWLHMTRRYVTVAALSAIWLGACTQAIKPSAPPTTAPEAHVSYRATVDPGTPRYETKDDENSTTPLPLDNPAPIYPENRVPMHLALVSVKAKLVVGGDGKVNEVHIPAIDAASGHPAEFDAAVRAAVLRWRFTPLKFTRWEYVEDKQGNVVDSRVIAVETRPFSLDYEFRFELRDGKPVVDGAAH
jgi:hypothetical protein